MNLNQTETARLLGLLFQGEVRVGHFDVECQCYPSYRLQMYTGKKRVNRAKVWHGRCRDRNYMGTPTQILEKFACHRQLQLRGLCRVSHWYTIDGQALVVRGKVLQVDGMVASLLEDTDRTARLALADWLKEQHPELEVSR